VTLVTGETLLQVWAIPNNSVSMGNGQKLIENCTKDSLIKTKHFFPKINY